MRSGRSSPETKSIDVVPGTAGATLRVALDSTAFADLFCERRTALGLVIGGRVEGDPASNEAFCAWDPVLRSLLDGRAVYQARRCLAAVNRRIAARSRPAIPSRRDADRSRPFPRGSWVPPPPRCVHGGRDGCGRCRPEVCGRTQPDPTTAPRGGRRLATGRPIPVGFSTLHRSRPPFEP